MKTIKDKIFKIFSQIKKYLIKKYLILFFIMTVALIMRIRIQRNLDVQIRINNKINDLRGYINDVKNKLQSNKKLSSEEQEHSKNFTDYRNRIAEDEKKILDCKVSNAIDYFLCLLLVRFL